MAYDPRGVFVPGHGWVAPFQNIVGDGTGTAGARLWERPADFDSGNYIEGYESIYGDSGETRTPYWHRNNKGINQADVRSASGWNPDAFNNFSISDHPDWVNQMDGKIKTAEKQATTLRWNFDPASNMWQPTITGSEGWDTNEHNRMRNLALGAVVGAGVGGIAAGYGATGAGAGNAAAYGGAAGAEAALGSAINPSIFAGQGAAGLGTAVGGIPGATVESLWPGATNFGPGYVPSLEGGGLLGGSGASGGMSLSDLASKAGQSISDYVSNPSNWQQIAQLGGLLGGALAGGSGGGQSANNAQPAIPVNTPALWGGADPGQWLGGGGYRPSQGPSQTQGLFNEYMAQQQRGLPGMAGDMQMIGGATGAGSAYGSKAGLLGLEPRMTPPRRSPFTFAQ